MSADPQPSCLCLICAGATESLSEAEVDTLRIVQHHGWQVTKIEADESWPSQAFSIGLHHSFGHPEVVIFGLATDVMHVIINNIGEDIRGGAHFEASREYPDILEGYNVVFRAVMPEQYPEHLGWGMWFYNYHPFPVVQLVWPDRQGRFPWQEGTSAEYQSLQPLLDVPPTASSPNPAA
ncbi:MAG: DUF4262 domain-containing protein [Chloroflexota bacterium]|nr:DUF4262 domain-containing protein [Chloroflexota bacterium]